MNIQIQHSHLQSLAPLLELDPVTMVNLTQAVYSGALTAQEVVDAFSVDQTVATLQRLSLLGLVLDNTQPYVDHEDIGFNYFGAWFGLGPLRLAKFLQQREQFNSCLEAYELNPNLCLLASRLSNSEVFKDYDYSRPDGLSLRVHEADIVTLDIDTLKADYRSFTVHPIVEHLSWADNVTVIANLIQSQDGFVLQATDMKAPDHVLWDTRPTRDITWDNMLQSLLYAALHEVDTVARHDADNRVFQSEDYYFDSDNDIHVEAEHCRQFVSKMSVADLPRTLRPNTTSSSTATRYGLAYLNPRRVSSRARITTSIPTTIFLSNT